MGLGEPLNAACPQVPRGSRSHTPSRQVQHSPDRLVLSGCVTLYGKLYFVGFRRFPFLSPLSEIPSSVILPRALSRKPLRPLRSPPPPLPPAVSWAGSGVGRALAHLAAAAPPPCLCPGRPRPSGGGPPAAGPRTGGPARPPPGGFPCSDMGEGRFRRGEGPWCGQFQDPAKPHSFVPSTALSLRLSQMRQVHTLLGSVQSGRTSWARSPAAPSAAAEPPAVPSRTRPTAPASHGGPGAGASAGAGGWLHTRLPGAPVAGPPPLQPGQLLRQPGVRDKRAGSPAGAQDSSLGTGHPASPGSSRAFWAGLAAGRGGRSPQGWGEKP